MSSKDCHPCGSIVMDLAMPPAAKVRRTAYGSTSSRQATAGSTSSRQQREQLQQQLQQQKLTPEQKLWQKHTYDWVVGVGSIFAPPTTTCELCRLKFPMLHQL